MDELTDLLAELAADAEAAIEYDRLAEERRKRIRENLSRARQAGAGPALLERTIRSIYVSRTISRWTADSAAPQPAKGHRKRPGASPAES